ncbi:hypothetical protein M5362_20760 [Streptomyces sp. Je 1-79]|uniref:hypothetical protein n=1 Tax=Streptomyces sp. Je 1-79 TaxID=2943847 RepID=UPI0021A945A7|nr:hypothetical protein [Streptomyces sp. Je 1-79]MCT4355572.1 hypothetical protein [Streptomyces sp. Je 1-79]
MNPYAVLAAAAAHWERLMDVLHGPLRERLAGHLAAVRRAKDADDRDAAVEAAVAVLRQGLPEEFGEAEAQGRFSADVLDDVYLGFRAEDLAVLVLDGHRMVGPVLGPVRDRLLAAPALDADTVLRRGGDPYARELIRLRGAGGVLRLPRFQFADESLPWLAVLEVNRLLEADRDPWGAADWWLSTNAWLGATPAELLGGPRERQLPDLALLLMEGE